MAVVARRDLSRRAEFIWISYFGHPIVYLFGQDLTLEAAWEGPWDHFGVLLSPDLKNDQTNPYM